MTIHLLPLEPLAERYTADWYGWFPAELDRLHVPYATYLGSALTTHVETGSVLDAFSTNHWKMTQLAEVIKAWYEGAITGGDTIFVTDLWMPGIESLAYIRSITGQSVKIVGILHAGTWDPNDFTVREGMRRWARGFETSLLQLADKIFVATEYHKNLITDAFGQEIHGLSVTGLPFYARELEPAVEKEPLVVFPHRMDREKRPDQFQALIRGLSDVECEFAYTWPTFKKGGKKAYYDLLGRAKVAVSFALQETFGYAMLEAAAMGCRIVVPNALSYPEVFPMVKGYDTLEEAEDQVRAAVCSAGLNSSVAYQTYQLHRFEGAIERMIDQLI